jgi:hypothetical protein
MAIDAGAELASRLVGRRLTAVIKRDNDWVFSFEGEAQLIVGSPWRVIFEGRNAFGDCDHGHQFGLPKAVDGVVRTERMLGERAATAVAIRSTGDLLISFGDDALEVIQTSCGYEAWELNASNLKVVAQGGGQLAIWHS